MPVSKYMPVVQTDDLPEDILTQLQMIAQYLGTEVEPQMNRYEGGDLGLDTYSGFAVDPVTGAHMKATQGGYPSRGDKITLGSFSPNTITIHTPVRDSTTVAHERLHSAMRSHFKPKDLKPGLWDTLTKSSKYRGHSRSLAYPQQFTWRDENHDHTDTSLSTERQHSVIQFLLNERGRRPQSDIDTRRNDTMDYLNQVPTPNRGTLKQIDMIRKIMEHQKTFE